MSKLIRNRSKLLRKGSKLANSINCCCDGPGAGIYVCCDKIRLPERIHVSLKGKPINNPPPPPYANFPCDRELEFTFVGRTSLSFRYVFNGPDICSEDSGNIIVLATLGCIFDPFFSVQGFNIIIYKDAFGNIGQFGTGMTILSCRPFHARVFIPHANTYFYYDGEATE